jgi:hypothetical protein
LAAVVSKKGASMPICLSDFAAGHSISLDLLVTAAGSPPAYSFRLTDPNDPDGKADLRNAKGDLDFSRSTKAVAVTINLKNSPNVKLRFDNRKHWVFSFSRDYGGKKYPIKKTHYQIRNVQIVDTAGQTVTFCYRNTKNDPDHPGVMHKRSQYGIFLIDPNGVLSPIDPGVGNGANK